MTDVRRGALGLVAVLVAVLAALVGLLALDTPEPAPADAPSGEFSATRALVHDERIAQRPRPIGSAAQADVRAYLVERLERLSARVEVHEDVVQRSPGGGTPVIATVRNIEARIPGTDSTGEIVLQAHYDSVPIGPGASDNGSNIGALLEIAYVLSNSRSLRNDVRIVLTDGEEPGLLGAKALVQSGRLSADRTIVLNLEARGSTGPTVMFRTVGPNASLIPAMAAANNPVTTSLADAVFSLLPNDTDLTMYRNTGFEGMDFARLDGSVNYDTATDTLDQLDPSAVQHTGETILTVSRRLGGQDLSLPAAGENLTYFTIWGWLVRYAETFVLPLAGFAVLGFLATLWYARRRGVRLLPVLLGSVTLLVPIVLAAGAGWLLWQVLLMVRPEYALLWMGDPYHPWPYRVALLLFAGVFTAIWYVTLRRRISAEQATLGLLSMFSALASLSAVLLPGAAYLFTWPALIGCAALAAALRWASEDSAWRKLAAGAAVLPTVGLLFPITVLLLQTFGVALGAVPAGFAVFFLVPLLPLLELCVPAAKQVRGGLIGLAGVAAVGSCVVGAAIDPGELDPARPRHTSLSYALDVTEGEARWLSEERDPPQWVDKYVGDERTDITKRFPNTGTYSPTYLTGPAPMSDDDPPGVADRVRVENGVRTVELRITPGEDTYRTAVYVDTTSHSVVSAEPAGLPLRGRVNRPWATAPWRWGFVYLPTPGEDSFEVSLRLCGDGPVPLRVISYRPGLPESAANRPDTLSWSLGLTNIRMIAVTERVG